MNRGPKGRYTKEFREQAVKLVLVDGLSQREVAGRLSLSVKTLGAWVVAERKGTLTNVGETQKPQSEWRRNWRGSSASWLRSRWSAIF